MIEVFLKSEGNTGCIEATDTFRIQVEPTPILNVPEISVCLGNVTTVFSQLPDSLKPRWYSQKNVFLSSGSSFTAQFDSTTTLILKAESTSGCRDSTFAKVWAFAKPQLNIRDTTICDGASVTLNARLTNVFQGNGVYAWLRNSLPLNNSGETFVARSSGKYTVTFGLLGCQTQDSAMVNVFNIQVQASDDQYVCKNQLATGINLVSVTATSAKVKWIGNGGNFSPNDSSKTTTYLPSLAESSANASKILVQTVGNGVCKEGKDSVLVYFKPYNLAAGTFETVCEGENSLLSSPLISGMVYEWKDSQGNIIGNSHQIQVNVQRDTSFLVKITNSNACSDSVTINVKPYPKPQIQIAGATTCLGDSLSLNGVPLNKNETFVQPIFEWYKDGIKLVNQDSILKIGTSGIYKIRYGQGICIGEDTAKMVFKKSTINVNNISPICVVLGARLTLSSSFSNADSLIWNSSGTGSFENQLILGQVDYLPSNSDFSSNKITFIAQTFSKNPKCLLVKDSTEMTILPSPKASGKGDTVCVGESALLQSTISANWQTRWLSGTTPLSSQINLVIANAITQEYILVVTDPNGCKDTTTVPLLTFDKPIISLQDTSTCLGDTLLLKPIIAASPFASTNYSWYKNGLPLPEKNALLNVFESGIYKLVFGEGGCIATDDAQVIIEEPKLTLNQPAPICKNYAGVISLNASLNTNRSIKWIGAGFFAPSDSDKVATYKPSISELTLDSFSIRVETIQNLKCIGVADQIMIKTLKAPLLNAASDTVCLGDSITLKKMPNNSESVRWIENGSIKSTNNVIRFPVLSSGSILLRASSLNGCVDSILVPYATFPKPLLQLNDVQTCVGDKPVLNGIPSNTNKANEKYRWYKGNTLLSQTTSFISVSDSGTYSLLYGQGNCTATDSAKVTFLPPTLNVFGDLEICRNKKEINFGANYTHADGVEWSTVLGVLPAMYQGKLVQYPYRSGDLVNDKSILVFAKLKQNNPLCQILSDTLEVVLKESPFLITSGDTLCKATLAEVEVQQELGTTYVWQDHLSNQLSTSNRYVYTPSKSEKIFLIAQNLNGCQDSTEVDVRLVATAGVTIQNSPACTGQMVSLEMKVSNDTVTGSKNIKWYYKGNKIAENINPISTSQSGSFSVIYSNKYCTDTASKEIFYNPSPLVAKEPELVFCSEAQPELQLDAGQYYGYLWQNDTSARGRYYQVSKGGSYKVLVFNQFGCSSEKMFSVREMCKPRLFVPNAFTPNGSNNNQFKVQHANIKSYQMLIFNRWGEIIFESLDPNISWNGTYRDEMMPLGVYPWVVTYEGFADEYGPYKLQGQVTVLK